MNITTLPYMGKRKVIVRDHNTDDILNEVLTAHKIFAADYDGIAGSFWKGNVLDTVKYIFQYCKKNFPYRVESEASQTTRSPGAIVNTSKKIGVDCKHYAGWIAGILSALERQGKKINWKYRFASYDLFESTPEHVFIVCKINGEDYWIDPVLKHFNQRIPGYIYSFDKKPDMHKNIGSIVKSNAVVIRKSLEPPVLVEHTSTPDIATGKEDSWTKYIPLILIAAGVVYLSTRKRKK